MRTLKIAILGYGNVGRAFVEMLNDKKNVLEQRGINPIVVGVSDAFQGSAFSPNGLCVSDLSATEKSEGSLGGVAEGEREADNARLLNIGADILVEASFTNPENGEPALSICKQAQKNGMQVITTNKGPAVFGQYDLAKNGFLFEGTVMSGTPVINFVKHCLPGAEVTKFRGILNGTSNYILGLMENGTDFDAALKAAQKLGYAEADPTADVEGYDVMMKVIIMSSILYGITLTPADVQVSGISHITPKMIQDAISSGTRWKLIGSGSFNKSGYFNAKVEAERLSADDLLYGVQGATNAIAMTTDVLGDVMIAGPGAGLKETAYALFSDMLSLAKTFS